MTERLLVVEDSRTQREALRLLLEDRGYPVEVAESAEEALDRIGRTRFDLVLSDIIMPGLNGYELCRRIKSEVDPAEAPVVVLVTRLSDPTDIVRGLESGADNYITKPYEPEKLIAQIEQVLENRALRRETSSAEGVPIKFLGRTFRITASREQILDLLLSSFENLVHTNNALQESQRALASALHREQESRRAAEAATRARQDVLAMVSHDLRNPLNAIYMTTGLLLDLMPAEEVGAAVREQVARIRKFAEQMDRLIEDLVDLGSLEAGQLKVHRRVQPVDGLVRDAIELHRPAAAHKAIALHDDVPDHVPPVLADRGRLLQVLSNLVGNSIKFSPEGGRIELRARPHNGEVLFCVVDQGPGIPPEHLEDIFNRFWKAGKGEAGAGLGLAIARGIVEAHGGRIWAESDPGAGASLMFTVPAVLGE